MISIALPHYFSTRSKSFLKIQMTTQLPNNNTCDVYVQDDAYIIREIITRGEDIFFPVHDRANSELIQRVLVENSERGNSFHSPSFLISAGLW